jgi:hypothetical protein
MLFIPYQGNFVKDELPPFKNAPHLPSPAGAACRRKIIPAKNGWNFMIENPLVLWYNTDTFQGFPQI